MSSCGLAGALRKKNELQSKLLKEAYIGIIWGTTVGVIKGDTGSLDYAGFRGKAPEALGSWSLMSAATLMLEQRTIVLHYRPLILGSLSIYPKHPPLRSPRP